MYRTSTDHADSFETYSDSLSSYSKISEGEIKFSNSQTNDIDQNEISNHSKATPTPAKKVISFTKGRKSKEIVKTLIQYYHMYEGHWDEENFKDLIIKTGYSKKQLNKWFWDRKER